MWNIQYYNKRLEKNIFKLPAEEVALYLRYTDSIIQYGPDLGMPRSRALGKGLYELRPKAARIYYGHKNNDVWMLFLRFPKQKNKAIPADLKESRKRLKELEKVGGG